MRTLTYILSIYLISSISLLHAQEAWFPVIDTLPDEYGVGGISAVNKDVIWAVALNWSQAIPPVPADHVSKVLRSLDGGTTWEVHDIEEAMGRVSWEIEAIDDTTAWITTQNLGPAGGRGLFKTTDGGASWTEMLNHPAGGVALHFFDKQEAVCINWLLMGYTTDAGANWQIIPSSSLPTPLEDEFFVFTSSTKNSFPVIGDTIWFGTTKGRMMRSTDRGRNWTIQSIGFGEVILTSMAFSDANNGLGLYLEGERNSELIRTTNGGDSWDQLTVPNELVLQEITHVPGTASTFVGVSWIEPVQTAITSDFGASWLIYEDTISPTTVTFLNNELGWMGEGFGSGDSPDIYQFKGNLISASQAIEPFQKINVFPNPFRENLSVTGNGIFVEEIGLINLSGQVLWRRSLANQEKLELSFSNLSLVPGAYFLRMKANGVTFFKRILKN